MSRDLLDVTITVDLVGLHERVHQCRDKLLWLSKNEDRAAIGLILCLLVYDRNNMLHIPPKYRVGVRHSRIFDVIDEGVQSGLRVISLPRPQKA